MNRRGFVLVSVLWILVALSAAGLAGLAASEVGAKASSNRIDLTRSSWSRAACVALIGARYNADVSTRVVDTLDLGQGSWCTGRLTNPHERLNLNMASHMQLRRVFRSDSLAVAFRDWIDPDSVDSAGTPEWLWYRSARRPEPPNRPLQSIEELKYVRGFSPATVDEIQSLATVLGEGVIDPPDAKPGTLLLEVSGGIRGSPIVARGTALLRVSGPRLVTLWQEMP